MLIKLIDAEDKLSIQVHPDDEYALREEGEYGKTEMWYIVDCEEDAYIYYGVKQEITRDEFAAHIRNNTLPDVLNKVPVKRGDVFFIPAGTIHAICSGILICEIQQNSNTTYRIYDYDRRDANGNLRQLHVKKAQDTASLVPLCNQPEREGDVLARCKYFTAQKLDCKSSAVLRLSDDSFRSLIILSGSGTIELAGDVLELVKGDSIFIPAQNVTALLNGNFEGIISYIA